MSCLRQGLRAGESSALSASRRAQRTREIKNFPGSSVIGRCAEFSNQTNCFDGAFTFANHSAATCELTLTSYRPAKMIKDSLSSSNVGDIEAEKLSRGGMLGEIVAVPDVTISRRPCSPATGAQDRSRRSCRHGGP